ncbi:MAG: hypothetical protein ABR508_07775 [Candidatus Baltobacteraceae bacterium]
MSTSAELLLETRDAGELAGVLHTLERFGEPALRFAQGGGVRIVPLHKGERYAERSAALRRLAIDVDAWPAPPAGLFVVEERMVYLRSRSPMTVAHEFGHALDCVLGGGVYHSTASESMRALFAQAAAYVTPYAATAPDEYFAESVRAYVEVNDPNSFWPRATRMRLKRLDPAMYAYVEALFACNFTQCVERPDAGLAQVT